MMRSWARTRSKRPSSLRRAALWAWTASAGFRDGLSEVATCLVGASEIKIPTLSHKARQGWGHPRLLFFDVHCRFQQQVLIVEAQVGERRNGGHSRAVDRAVGVQ